MCWRSVSGGSCHVQLIKQFGLMNWTYSRSTYRRLHELDRLNEQDVLLIKQSLHEWDGVVLDDRDLPLFNH